MYACFEQFRHQQPGRKDPGETRLLTFPDAPGNACTVVETIHVLVDAQTRQTADAHPRQRMHKARDTSAASTRRSLQTEFYAN